MRKRARRSRDEARRAKGLGVFAAVSRRVTAPFALVAQHEDSAGRWSRWWVWLPPCICAVLYCCALPLWEGFDEPFHYAYIETVVRHHEFPVLGRTAVSREVSRSLQDVPLSRFLSGAVGGLSFEEWAKLPEPQRRLRERAMGEIPTGDREQVGGLLNYEAQQAPLAYLLLAPADFVFGRVPLRTRILLLRLGMALGVIAAVYWGLDRLAALIQLEEPLRAAAIFFVLQMQMLWASVAHVGNDALAVPLTLWFVVWVGRARSHPSTKSVASLAAVLCAGLLTKAYFLSLIPLFLALLVSGVVRRRVAWKGAGLASALLLPAIPWYVRNVWLYGSLSGTQQSAKGIGPAQAFAAIPHISWTNSVWQYAHASLWTGNWSFLSFSRTTINCELFLLAAGFVAYLVSRGRRSNSERWMLTAGLLFAFGLVYQTCVTWVESQGQSLHPEPWYAQGMVAALVVFCFAGLRDYKLWARIAAAALTWLACWVAIATWAAKLLPFYGAGLTRANVQLACTFWTNHPGRALHGVTAAPLPAVVALMAAYLLLAGGAAAIICRALFQRPLRSATPLI